MRELVYLYYILIQGILNNNIPFFSLTMKERSAPTNQYLRLILNDNYTIYDAKNKKF